MSCVNANTSIDIELADVEKDNLIQSYKILKNISDDMWNEDLEDTDEAFKIGEARESIRRVMSIVNVDVEEE